MKDERLYGRFSLTFPSHAKIMPLSDAAFRCLVEATLWSREHMTDGFLPKRLAIARWDLDVLQELATNDPDNPSLIEAEDGWRIHDFAEHQTTKSEIEALREVRKAAGRRGGLAKAEAKRKQVLQQKASKTYPETETETETSNYSVVTSSESPTEVVTSVGRAKKRGTRIDPEWMPQQSTVDAIKAETGASRDELAYQHRKFIDYWTEKTGQAATKVTWDGTWRNWMRTAAERGEIGKTAATVTAGTGTNGRPHKLRVLADLANEVREMESTNGREIEQ